MPLTDEQRQQAAQSWLKESNISANTPQPDFGVPKEKDRDLDDQINSMPNSDKLTRGERWVYGKLPGVTSWMENHRIMGRTISEQLDKFNNSWAGKALNLLDVFAEGMERTVGLVGQLNDKDFDVTKDLKAAWYAGSLTYDTANLPVLKKNKDGEIIGLTVPTDLPGSGGVSQARAKIQAFVDQGMDYQSAKEKAMDELYNGLGALALRSQLNDLYGHVLLDPLNALAWYLKPLEAVKARRFAALGEKIAGGAPEFLQAADRAGEFIKTAANAEDAFKYADEAFQLAAEAGDVQRASKYADQAASLAKQLGKTDELARYTGEATRFAGMGTEEAAEFSESALKALGKKQLTSLDRAAIMLGGGDPFRPSRLGEAVKKIPVVGFIAKQFELTPAAKAQELSRLFVDNIGTNLASRLWNEVDAEWQFTSAIRRIEKGAVGIEFGHSLTTLEGRTIQGLASGMNFDIERLFASYQELAPTRGRLQLLSESLGESPTKLLSMMDENPEAVLVTLAKHAPENPNLALALQNGEFTADSLKGLAKTLDGVPHNKEMFFAQALDAIETAAMRQAVVQFGVKSKGVMTRWSEALKAAESLAFLKLNPAYPIRNVINNEVTMLARGLFGVFGPGEIDNFWKDFGYIPQRLEEALTPAGELAKKASKASEAQRILEDALRGGEWGKADKIKEFFQKINLGRLDSTQLGFKGSTFEQIAGRRAYTTGTMQYLRNLWKPKSAREYINPKVLDEIEGLAPGFSTKIENAIRSSGAMDAKFDQLLGTNLNLSVDNILDDVSRATGKEVREMLGDEVLQHLHNKLPEALQKGNVDALKIETRQLINKHIDDLFTKQMENVVEHVKAQAVAGGPNVWNSKLAEAQDIFWGAHIEHSVRMPEATRLAREAASVGDFKTASALWKQEAEDARLFYDRAFRRVDAYIEGLEKGADELAARGANVKAPFKETRRTFNQWKGMWEDFFKESNKMKDEFFEAAGKTTKGKPPRKWDDVQAELDGMYKKAIQSEDEYMQRIDDTIGAMIPDPQAKQAYTNARDALAQMRKTDKELVTQIRKEVAELPPEARQDRWNQFWQERQARQREMRSVDAASIMIQQGDENAMQAFAEIGKTARTTGREERAALEAEQAELNTKLWRTEGEELEATRKRLSEVDELLFPSGKPQPTKASAIQPNYAAEVKKIVPDPAPINLSQDLMAYGRIYGTLDEVVDGAKAAAKKTPTLLSDLPANLQDEVLRGMKQVKNDLASTRYQASKFGEWRRDSALLNYNRRTNFDNNLAHIAPFSFWTTSSMQQWALESIDRPAMLTNYLRTKKFMDTAGLQRDGMASRTKGKIRINLPFAPEWMGEQFIDPLRVALPFDNWLSPFEQFKKDQQGADGRTQRVLDQLLKEGKVTQDDYDQAIATGKGTTWDYAEGIMQQNDTSERYDAWDFATTMAAPHAPIMWAYNAAFGDKEDIGPFSPLSRLMRNAATQLGVEDWNNNKYNLEAKVRRQMGLSSYDKWDDYRIDRALSDLAGDGSFTPDEVKEALAVSALVQKGDVTPEQAKQMSEAYREGVKRSNQEFTGGPLAFGLGLLGMSVTSVPKGENELRKLQDDFGLAYEKYKKANDSLETFLSSHADMEEADAAALWEKQNPKLAKEGDALTDFFNEHPEYETRLGLFDTPEEKHHKFMIDQVWKRYNELPTLNQNEVREALGADFQEAFLNKETRSYDDVPTELMSVWLKLMGADPLGGLTADQRILTSLYGRVQMTDPETANRVQTFYDTRKGRFEDYYDLQNGYYKIQSKADRTKYKREHPELQQYWDWRTHFMIDNPDLVPYLTDNEKAIAEAKKRARNPANAVPTAQEIQVNLPPDMNELLAYYNQTGAQIPQVLLNELDYYGQGYGMSGEQLLNVYNAGQFGVR